MTPSRKSQAATAPPPPDVDPLAALREPDHRGLEGDAPPEPEPQPDLVGDLSDLEAAIYGAPGMDVDPREREEVMAAVREAMTVRLAGTKLITEDEQDRLRHQMVAAMHNDLTVQGFIHGGGNCGCWYISGIIAQAIAPVQVNSDPEE